MKEQPIITIEMVKEKTIERFWSKIKFGEINECWEWQDCMGNHGYGAFNIHPKTYTSHGLMYALIYETPKKGLCVLHKCDNRKCVNPNHFFLGTRRENMEDMRNKGRDYKFKKIYKGSKHGCSKLTENDIPIILSRIRNGEEQSKIAREYDVTSALISLIKKRKLWKHVEIENEKQIAV